MKPVGKFILRVLKEKKKSLRWLGRESGVSNSYLSQVTRGVFSPTPEVLIRLSTHLGVEPRRLFEEAGWLKPGGAEKAAQKTKAKKRREKCRPAGGRSEKKV